VLVVACHIKDFLFVFKSTAMSRRFLDLNAGVTALAAAAAF
jgi:hypothetical protein